MGQRVAWRFEKWAIPAFVRAMDWYVQPFWYPAALFWKSDLKDDYVLIKV